MAIIQMTAEPNARGKRGRRRHSKLSHWTVSFLLAGLKVPGDSDDVVFVGRPNVNVVTRGKADIAAAGNGRRRFEGGKTLQEGRTNTIVSLWENSSRRFTFFFLARFFSSLINGSARSARKCFHK